jgi:hypothetical protein
MIATLVTLLVALLAPVALAAIQCRYPTCIGTDQRDRLLERKGQGLSDAIYGKDRGDLLNSQNYIRDGDELFGQRGNDTLRAQDEDNADVLKGGKGFDTCYADALDVLYSCEDPHILPGEGA